MYSNKRHILELVTLLQIHGIQKIVLCPGSRNIPIIQTITNIPYFLTYQLTDERSAAFFALGLALHGGQPTAICCTSGSALANIYPAVLEAYYQQVPLLVISADRPEAWIGQMDGQTMPQRNFFAPTIKQSVDLKEPQTDEDMWMVNRSINDALLALTHRTKGPSHINIQIGEPFFDFDVDVLPSPRSITRYHGLNIYDRDYQQLIDKLNHIDKKMVIVGQHNLIYLFEKKYTKMLYKHFTWLSENISNQTIPGLPIQNFDQLLYKWDHLKQQEMAPDLVITYGGHIISKRLKQYIRKFKPKEHWHVSNDGQIIDLFGALTTVIEMNPFEFLERIAPMMETKTSDYPRKWEQASKEIAIPKFSYSEMYVIGQLIEKLPMSSCIHLANSSTIRYAQLYPIRRDIEVLSNRGINGIEGSLSTAIGYAASSTKINFIIIGDLSFFYDMNGLWNKHFGSNVRIMLINNQGGEIFNTLPKLQLSIEAKEYVIGTHSTTAKSWAEDRGFTYLSSTNDEEYQKYLGQFVNADLTTKPILWEIFTDKDKDVQLLKEYYHNLKE